MVKSVTSGTNNGDERSTSIAQLDCSDLFGYRLTLYRPLPKELSGMPGPARLEAGGIRLSLLPGATKAIAFWTTVARPDEIQNLAAQREIDISFVYPRGQETAVAIKMSTAGLLMGLDELQKYCSQRKVKPSAG